MTIVNVFELFASFKSFFRSSDTFKLPISTPVTVAKHKTKFGVLKNNRSAACIKGSLETQKLQHFALLGLCRFVGAVFFFDLFPSGSCTYATLTNKTSRK